MKSYLTCLTYNRVTVYRLAALTLDTAGIQLESFSDSTNLLDLNV